VPSPAGMATISFSAPGFSGVSVFMRETSSSPDLFERRLNGRIHGCRGWRLGASANGELIHLKNTPSEGPDQVRDAIPILGPPPRPVTERGGVAREEKDAPRWPGVRLSGAGGSRSSYLRPPTRHLTPEEYVETLLRGVPSHLAGVTGTRTAASDPSTSDNPHSRTRERLLRSGRRTRPDQVESSVVNGGTDSASGQALDPDAHRDDLSSLDPFAAIL
jgi:hypothetical protein